jgi:plastocyanin
MQFPEAVMSKALVAALMLAGVLSVMEPVSVQAQSAKAADEMTLRPGDRITWTVTAPHRVRFGGTVTHSGAALPLTPFGTVESILDIAPKLTPDANGIAMAAPGETVTATVKSTAAPGSEFFFTCGFPPHTGMMVTVSFTIAAASAGQPARNVEIVSANPPRWLLKTPGGDKDLTRP